MLILKKEVIKQSDNFKRKITLTTGREKFFFYKISYTQLFSTAANVEFSFH